MPTTIEIEDSELAKLISTVPEDVLREAVSEDVLREAVSEAVAEQGMIAIIKDSRRNGGRKSARPLDQFLSDFDDGNL